MRRKGEGAETGERAVTKGKPRKRAAVAKQYQPTEREMPTLQAQRLRWEKHPPQPRAKLTAQVGTTAPGFSIDHPDRTFGQLLFLESLGTANDRFAFDIMCQLSLMYAHQDQPIDAQAKALNTALETTRAIKPRDEIETMFGVQMTAIHRSLVRWEAKATRTTSLEVMEMCDRAINRLSRTYAAQIEALKKYRTGGEQKVTVEHVHVHAGGQAIVGNVEAGGNRS